jgi:hypothetical protein
VVETAIVIPIFLVFVLCILEFSHAIMVRNVLRGACREGARIGSTAGMSSSDVETRVRQILGSAVNPDAVNVFVKDASVFDGNGTKPVSGEEMEALPDVELADLDPRQLFMVRARVDYYDAALVPIAIPFVGNFLENVVLEGQALVRHE